MIRQRNPAEKLTAPTIAAFEAFATDTHDLSIQNAPLLTRPATAGDDEYRCPLGWCAALHVEAHTAADHDDLAVADGPLLVRRPDLVDDYRVGITSLMSRMYCCARTKA
jgi:hypothetical protein